MIKFVWVQLVLIALLFCTKAPAQIPVREESHHKVVLENEYIRVIDGQVPVNDTTVAHIHSTASVVVFLSQSTFGIQVAGQPPVIADVKPGDTRYLAYGEKPVNHKVWNQSKGVFHFIVVEMVRQGPGKDTCAMLTRPEIKLILRQKLVKAYSLDPGNTFNLPKSNCAHLLIDINGMITVIASGDKHSLQTNGFLYLPPRTNLELHSANKVDAKCILLELE